MVPEVVVRQEIPAVAVRRDIPAVAVRLDKRRLVPVRYVQSQLGSKIAAKGNWLYFCDPQFFVAAWSRWLPSPAFSRVLGLSR